MKFTFTTFFTCLLALSTSVIAQSVQILQPSPGANVPAGSPLTVQIGFPNSLTGVQHIAATISLLDCAGQNCLPTSESLGRHGVLLIDRNFNPTYHTSYPTKPPYSEYTVTIPVSTPTGPNTIAVSHFMLLGASTIPILEFANVTINIV